MFAGDRSEMIGALGSFIEHSCRFETFTTERVGYDDGWRSDTWLLKPLALGSFSLETNQTNFSDRWISLLFITYFNRLEKVMNAIYDSNGVRKKLWFSIFSKYSITLVYKIKIFFLLAGHKVDFIAPCGANKSTFWPASRKKIVCNTRKKFILLVWLLPSLCSGIKLHTRKINFFFPSCTMYYFCPPHLNMIFSCILAH